jgi:FkbM family methyltransferase
MKFYDFKPGLPAVSRMLCAAILKWISARRQSHSFQLFTDGVGYIDQQIAADGLFEKGLIELMLDIARKNNKTKLYIDIGANIGNHLVASAKHFDKAVGFDPHPVLFHVLSANVMINGLSNVELHNIGLGKSNIDATLVESASNHGLSRVKEHSRLSADTFGLKEQQFDREYKIKLVNAQEFLTRYGDALNSSLIKIDVEGMEFEILQSILPIMDSYKPLIAFEWFHAEQPEIAPFLQNLKNYDAFGGYIKQPKNSFLRFAKNILCGRQYELEKISGDPTPRYYPLVFLVPKE